MLDEYVRSQLEESERAGFTCVEAEENILRRMVLQQGVADDIATELVPDDFSRKENGMIFWAIQSLVMKKQQVDLVSVDAELQRLFVDKIDLDILVQTLKPGRTSIERWQSVEAMVRIVRELSTRRKAIASLEGLVEALRDPTRDIDATLAEIADATEKIETGDAEWTTIGSVLLDTFEYIDARQTGSIKAITTGVGALDKIIGGFFPEELTVIAARPSVGKSAFGANVALAAAKQGHKVGIVSCEMSAVGLGQRLLSHGSYVDGMHLRRADVDPEAWARLSDALQTMSDLPIRFLFDKLAIEDVVKTVRRQARKGEIEILIVDYLQFMETRRTFREERHKIAYISHSLKRLARTAKIPVIALAQVTREGEGAMPTMRMLRESGDIEQDADGIIFLHRAENESDSAVNPLDRPHLQGIRDKGLQYVCLGVAKQRNGSVGQTAVLFDPSIMMYTDIDREKRGNSND